MEQVSINREKTFTVKGNQYSLKFPNIGQYLDVESLRMRLSDGTYQSMLRSNLVSSGIAMDMIDMISTLTILCPQLLKDMKSSTILDLDIMEANELLTVYKKDVSTWVDSWMKLLSSPPKIEGAVIPKEPEGTVTNTSE